MQMVIYLRKRGFNLRLLTKNRIAAVLKATRYIVLNFGRIKKDFIMIRKAVADLQISPAEARDSQRTLDRHMEGLGFK